MQTWMIAANEKMFDCAAAFEELGSIDWTQKANFDIGDVVYIYCTAPYKRIMYKTVVKKTRIPFNQMIDDSKFWTNEKAFQYAQDGTFVRLKMIEQSDTDFLNLDHLLRHGLKMAPRGPMKVTDNLRDYIEKYIKDDYSEGFFPESSLPEESYEGAVKAVVVNRYERSSTARRKCIEYYGCKCLICGLDFEERYGEIGKDFIHVHHIVPLNEIGKEYTVDYTKDLIPVCPNCHAMLHRKINGKEPFPEELKAMIR